MTEGIYTLANDVVYDQLVALLNSIETNIGTALPVYVIAYDDRIDRVREAVKTRKNVELFEDKKIFARWENFSLQVWQAHPYALKSWQEKGIDGVYRIGMNRRYCAFDPSSPFEKFAYFDADVLVLNSLDTIFDTLNQHDFVVYDFQYNDISHIYNQNSPNLLNVFDQNQLNSEIFCAGFYASKRGLLPPEQRKWLVSQLESGEAEVLYPSAPNQSVLNYLVMRSGISVYNLALHLPENQRTGNSVTSSHFEKRNHLLYDKETRLTYLHYIGVSSKLIQRVCAGENLDFPYRDIFLHYRYLHEPEQKPQFKTKPQPYNKPPSLGARILRKLKLT
ncbi:MULTISPECIES: Npun_R2821/Npun_R2822 family protein [unclassified Coleofasciculus]|uniref:Npun_R2821/Npun_R2822 family protein n=1 Tax=unclassified Coleofasciculus TaxID=2692782 RepID=UPI001881BFC9|nr:MULTISPECIES: Npun_R2821/Npun_R2822 family protein [unclassified Coleofasciculus]MBE9124807.1 sugar transferase [Coleofasciculus sp. LEGE 07081]MBE9147712.1 sugar transferase [Coleofasciculus sp. LEGE 07092]